MYLPSLPSALSRTKHILKIKENTKSFQKQTKESQTDYHVYFTCFKLQEKSLTSFSCSKKMQTLFWNIYLFYHNARYRIEKRTFQT